MLSVPMHVQHRMSRRGVEAGPCSRIGLLDVTEHLLTAHKLRAST
jgi:hypothetical protein